MTAFARRSRWATPAAGLIALAALLLIAIKDPGGVAEKIREAAFDRMIASTPREATTAPVAVIDIDRAALDKYGSWPWPRDVLARIIQNAAPHRPAAIAFDMLIAEQRGGEDADAAQPGVAELAAAMRGAPVILGAVLDPSREGSAPEGPPLVVQGASPDLPGLMIARGVSAPVAALRDAARGVGILTLAAPNGEPVRRAPLLAAGAGVIFGGLSVEALRVASGDGNLIVDGPARALRIGPHTAPLGVDADLWLWSSSTRHRAARTIPALTLLDEPQSVATQIAGKIVVVGASAPEAGGLRPTGADPFTPSAQIHADAIEQIMTGRIPTRPASARLIETLASVGLALAMIIAVMRWPPSRAGLASLLLIAAWIAACILIWRWRAQLVDPVWPALTGALAWQAANLAAFADARRRRLMLERSFAARLPPEIVARLADDPDQLKLAGEEREITALFTDIEGFTAMTDRLAPVDLVALLDRYFDQVCAIIVAHGGMVDKFVGDAVHAFFNAPVDLPDHAARAVDCALAIRAATEEFRQRPDNVAFGLGRTRIGVETGRAVLGDVGGGRKLDYTAHGTAINLAARLEASNKVFGSSVAVGPRCRELNAERSFRELGEITPFAGAAPLPVYEPAPDLKIS